MESVKTVGAALVAGSIFCILISLLRKKETFFNLREVVECHLSLFKECKFQYVVFYGFPLLFAVGLAMLYEAGTAFYSELSVIMGILLGMLFAILSIMAGHDFSGVEDAQQRSNVKQVVNETINAIIFDSMLCLFLMLYGLIIIVLEGVTIGALPVDVTLVKAILSGVAYYLFVVILLTLLLIVKHMSKIINFNLTVRKKS